MSATEGTGGLGSSTRPPGRARRTTSRVVVLLAALAAVGGAVVLSLMIGSQALSPVVVLRELFRPGDAAGDPAARDIVRGLRMDRTVVAIAVGLALGGAGALMQALTRNPLADPGLLGVNAGAAAAVVTGIAFLDLADASAQVWLAFAGAALAAVAVYVLGSGGAASTTPLRLALAGAALTAVLTAYVHGLALSSQANFDAMRFWLVGSVTAREIAVLGTLLPFLLAGGLLALALTPALNAMALGDDAGRALGVRVGRLRLLTAAAITLLCGAATALAGPIVFLGLVLPHVARHLVGPDQRWVVPLSMLLSAVLLLLADTAGRVITHREIEAGIMTAFLGAPVFIALVRRRRLAHL
ncbi:iron chelate uptake ABC transporter family permease subunit [Nocardioides sp. zg-536]|uniref:Iron chelate uptake ABC transporter family permease subunit n=1 Tax=Nocardioides faecalis TaxID=2803858 RepID=A0A939BWT5_9ACTN|nr:iron chelate uptake ABC transporter family permease subunit [Nocardioides faecalis]MBM9458698.1 iron chelate uptake ABC transporter family permease subunit [Nocardioides faecalis]QVI58687.1 iron chelate uptake ABC transporter family permease subunit [Nocardioides faecalis]